MRTVKLKLELPDRDELVRGLDPRSCWPALAKAELAVVEAKRMLEQRQRDLAEHQMHLDQSPARVQSGHAPAKALPEAIRERDAAAMLLEAAIAEIAKRNAAVDRERPLAAEALRREFDRRAQLLEAAVAEINPLLVEIRTLAAALDKARGDGGMLRLEWVDSPATLAESRMHADAAHMQNEAARRAGAVAAQVVSTMPAVMP